MVLFPHWPKFSSRSKSSDDIYDSYNICKVILDNIGNPQNKIPPIIHVAGTNGKGSVVAHLKSILEESGYKLHIYTSPHLISFNERIIVAGKIISDRYLHEIMEKSRMAVGDYSLGLFSATTIAAFIAFAENDADFTIVEVGLGGEFDITNTIEKSIISVITPISYDHVDLLGNSIEEIAYTKSGIIKPDSCCVISRQRKDVLRVLELRAMRNKALIHRQDFEWYCDAHQEKYMKFTSFDQEIIFRRSALIGGHQIDNAGTAIAAVSLLDAKYGFDKITYDSISEGIKKVYWPARLEKIEKGKVIDLLPAGWEIFLDGAHNDAGSKVIADWIAGEDSKPTYAVIGVTRGKDRRGFLGNLKSHIEFMYGVCVRSEYNAETSSEIVRIAQSLGIDSQASDSVKDAIIDIGVRFTPPARIIICGSLYLAGDVNKINEGVI